MYKNIYPGWHAAAFVQKNVLNDYLLKCCTCLNILGIQMGIGSDGASVWNTAQATLSKVIVFTDLHPIPPSCAYSDQQMY